ncbi:uncharacterized protein [Palaemon carinicauda]|uniref:uncharacterized protein n=1 Tax=Palaemon carinicauda TaxID=392227 RepID=UPI0035B5C2AB
MLRKYSRLRRPGGLRREYKKLRSLLPGATRSRHLRKKVGVVEAAYQYICQLQAALLDKFSTKGVPEDLAGIVRGKVATASDIQTLALHLINNSPSMGNNNNNNNNNFLRSNYANANISSIRPHLIPRFTQQSNLRLPQLSSNDIHETELPSVPNSSLPTEDVTMNPSIEEDVRQECPSSTRVAELKGCRQECPSSTTVAELKLCRQECPSSATVAEFKGCRQECPSSTTVAEFKGCRRECPSSATVAEFKGCRRECPSSGTIAEFKGCRQECPSSVTVAEFKGCRQESPSSPTVAELKGFRQECPSSATVAEFKGCRQECPSSATVTEFKGCRQECPSSATVAEFKGSRQECPSSATVAEFKGCPQECPSSGTLAEFKGCFNISSLCDNNACVSTDYSIHPVDGEVPLLSRTISDISLSMEEETTMTTCDSLPSGSSKLLCPTSPTIEK